MTVFKWLGSSSGNWTDAANWSGDAVPGVDDSAIIEAGAATDAQYTVTIASAVQVASLLLDAGGAVLSVGDLTDGGSLVAAAIDLKAGTLALAAGTLSGTVTAGPFGMFQFDYGYYDASGSTLNDVTWKGNFEPILTGIDNSQYLDIAGGLTLAGTNGSGKGTVLLQNGASLDFLGTQSLTNATVSIGGADYSTGAICTIESAASLVLGSSLNMKVLALTHLTTSGAITNDGTINAKGGLLIEGSGVFTNAGLMDISGKTDDAIGHFVNKGTIDVTGGTLTLTQSATSSWSNSGVIDAAGGSVFLAGTVTAAQLERFAVSDGGTLGLAGTLLNAGATLSLGTPGLPSLVLDTGGVIDGGTVEGVADVTLKGGTLEGVTWDGNVDLASEGATLTIRNGIMLRPGGTIAVSGFGAEVIFAGASRTLAHSDIVVGGSSYSSAGRLLVGSGTSAETLKLGAASKLQLLSGATISGDALVNDGVIEASAGFQATLTLQTLTNAGLIDLDGTGGSFQIGAQIGTFTNSGTLDVSNQISLDFNTQFDGPAETWTSTGVVDVTNATLTLGGTLTTASLNTVDAGTGGVINLDENLQNGGATLDLAHFAAGTLSLGGTISGGTLAADGGTLGLALGSDAGLAGVVVQGDLALGGDSTLQVTGGLTLDAGSGGAGTLNTAGVQVNFAGSQGVTGGEIAFGTIGVLAEGAGLTTLDLNPQTELVQATVFASLSNGGTGTPLVANGNLIEAGVAGGTLLISGIHLGNYSEFLAEDGDSVEVAGGTFTNAGTLSLAGTGTAFTLGDDSEATAFDNSAHVSIAGGVLNDGDAGGGLDTGNVWANTGTIAVDGGVLSLNAAYSTGGLGAIIVSDGGSVALRGALDNSGATLTLGTGTALGALSLLYGTISGGTIVDLGGGIVARGGVLDGVTYDGVLDLSAASATLGIAGGLTMHGSNGAGTSSILLTGAGSDLVFAGGDSETLNDTTLSFGAADRLTVN